MKQMSYFKCLLNDTFEITYSKKLIRVSFWISSSIYHGSKCSKLSGPRLASDRSFSSALGKRQCPFCQTKLGTSSLWSHAGHVAPLPECFAVMAGGSSRFRRCTLFVVRAKRHALVRHSSSFLLAPKAHTSDKTASKILSLSQRVTWEISGKPLSAFISTQGGRYFAVGIWRRKDSNTLRKSFVVSHTTPIVCKKRYLLGRKIDYCIRRYSPWISMPDDLKH